MDGRREGHYFDTSPAVGSRRRTIPLVLPDVTVELVADRGVFSGDRVDPGTRYLLLAAPKPPPGAANLLDLGCGYGPISVALALRAPDATVWAVDVNERARELCRENAARAGVGERVQVRAPDEVPDHIPLDAIWSNPPVRIGKSALHELLSKWLGRLAPGGHAYLVVQRNLGSDTLQRWLDAQGWPTQRLGSRAGYRLLEVTRDRR